MSRVGKMPIELPKDVEVTISAEKITVKGPQGTLSLPLTGQVVIKNENGTLNLTPADESREANAMSGTVRALVNNMVNGVTKGFEKKIVAGRCGLQSTGPGRQAESVAGFFAPYRSLDACRCEVRNAYADGNRYQGY